MKTKWAVVAGVALLVLFVVRRAGADPRDPANWNYRPGYAPGSGYMA